jgi:acyl carrier protein
VDRSYIKEALRQIIGAELDIDPPCIIEATTLHDIPEWDSVAHFRIIIAVESEFGILFTLEEHTEFADIGEMINCICAKLTRQHAASAGRGGGTLRDREESQDL